MAVWVQPPTLLLIKGCLLFAPGRHAPHAVGSESARAPRSPSRCVACETSGCHREYL